jgi:hypothetical protein
MDWMLARALHKAGRMPHMLLSVIFLHQQQKKSVGKASKWWKPLQQRTGAAAADYHMPGHWHRVVHSLRIPV